MQRENSSRPLLLVAAPLLTPLLVTAVWLRRHHFGPLFDVAMTEARVRDVGTVHTPLLGLPGRLGDDKPGSHPGPLSFYLLAPLYRVMGGTYWALRFSQLALNGAVIVAPSNGSPLSG